MGRNPKVDWEQLEDVILGCANQAGEDNRNIARMALLLAGLPYKIGGETVNRLCSSGMAATIHAYRSISLSEGDLFIAGGIEHMTRGPLVISKASKDIFIPITVGGGIRSIDDATKAFKSGADKVAINTAAVENNNLINQLSEKFGSQSIVLSVEAKKIKQKLKQSESIASSKYSTIQRWKNKKTNKYILLSMVWDINVQKDHALIVSKPIDSIIKE